ncbi:MAG: hypothetical protein OEY38_22615 [Gammaproteobacteria bacterium]|nr:hypothetical protein [Gammaproteobacteria bacterium]
MTVVALIRRGSEGDSGFADRVALLRLAENSCEKSEVKVRQFKRA